jgi:regulator of replication initiation timing
MGADFFFCTFAIGMKPRVVLPVQALLVVGLLSAGLHAQNVGIGTANPDPSARLHISDNARGLLIPNVALTGTNDVTTIPNPAISLLVYNPNPAGSGATAVTPGFYYWDGSQWVRLGSGGAGGGNAWLLNGNAGTNPAVNFLGTTDNQPLVIRVNNQETFRFNPPGTSAPAWSIQRGGGNQRGFHAVDLQSARAQATQVASGNYSVIGGGENNTASGVYATVGGGWFNTASSGYATVGGGYANTASSAFGATVGGGWRNTASGLTATVGGGERNTASGNSATVGGGEGNTAGGEDATVGGGFENTAWGNYSVVPGGRRNTANASYNLVFGENVGPSVAESHRVYFFSPANSGFLVINRLDGDHPIHVGTNGTNGNGAHLTNAGVWTNGSSRSFKERFVQYRPAEVLEKILQLPVEGYFYKGTQEYHITPMAEDFYRLFGTGVHEIIETDSTGQLVRRPNPDVDKYLAASDVAGVALLGVQALHEENAQLRQRVFDMRAENAQLRQRVSDLETENTQLRQQISDIRTENAQLRQHISDIRTENAALRARLERLETLMQRIASTQTNP